MVDRLKELIHFQSYSGQEGPVLKYIKAQMEKSGVKPFFQGDNLAVRLPGKDLTRAFIFNGHVDVVDIGDHKKWKHDPWAGEVVGDRIYGRGTSDMKGGILALMKTAEALAKKGIPPTDVWFTFVVREETDGEGTKQFINWFLREGYMERYHDLAAVFAEPTELKTVQHGHRGNFFIVAEKKGVSGHASRPQNINPHAIVEMSRFILALEEQRFMWQKEFKGGEFSPPSITPTSQKANSESPNSTADHSMAIFDLRTIPGYHQEAFDRIKELADQRGIKLSLLYPPSPTGYTKKDARIVRLFEQFDPKVNIGVNDASNDLGFFTNVGIDSVVFGPGEMTKAHTLDESGDINQIRRAPGMFLDIYRAWSAS